MHTVNQNLSKIYMHGAIKKLFIVLVIGALKRNSILRVTFSMAF